MTCHLIKIHSGLLPWQAIVPGSGRKSQLSVTGDEFFDCQRLDVMGCGGKLDSGSNPAFHVYRYIGQVTSRPNFDLRIELWNSLGNL